MNVFFLLHPSKDVYPEHVRSTWFDPESETKKVNRSFISKEQYTTLKQDKNNKFFYIIEVTFINFLQSDSFRNIDNYILEELRIGNVDLLIEQITEEQDIFSITDYRDAVTQGWPKKMVSDLVYNTVFGKLRSAIAHLNIPESNCHFASSFFYFDDFISELEGYGVHTDISFHYRDYFLELYSKVDIVYDDSDEEKLLYAAYGAGYQQKKHKVDTIYELWKRNLLSQGQISINKLDPRYTIESHYAQEFLNLLPIKNTVAYIHNIWNDPFQREYSDLKKVLVYISIETFNPNNYCFLTEKTYRAIAYKLPFLIVGNKHSLKKLHDLGFKTFNDFWNEDYDNFETIDERINAVVDRLEYIQHNTEILQDVKHITSHNYNILTQDWHKRYKKSLLK